MDDDARRDVDPSLEALFAEARKQPPVHYDVERGLARQRTLIALRSHGELGSPWLRLLRSAAGVATASLLVVGLVAATLLLRTDQQPQRAAVREAALPRQVLAPSEPAHVALPPPALAEDRQVEQQPAPSPARTHLRQLAHARPARSLQTRAGKSNPIRATTNAKQLNEPVHAALADPPASQPTSDTPPPPASFAAPREQTPTSDLVAVSVEDAIQQEMEGLARAERLLSAAPARALQLLEADERLYKPGYLHPERRLLIIRALVAVGRSKEAEQQAERWGLMRDPTMTSRLRRALGQH